MLHGDTDTDTDSELVARQARLSELRSRFRREGSLAAALVQSMALAVICTAGAYPSWVLVKSSGGRYVVLGASWAVMRIDPEPDSPLLGPWGAPVLFAIAYCCLWSLATGSVALVMDFLGRRRGRSWAPLLHGVTAMLIGSSSACGSCLLALIRGRVRSVPELVPLRYTIVPGQSLFLSFLACFLAATATGLSCSSPARVQPARSSWDLGRTTRRALRRPPQPREEEEARPEATPSLESVMWQEGRLSSFLMDEDEVILPPWYDRPSRLRSAQRSPEEKDKEEPQPPPPQKSRLKAASTLSESRPQLAVPSPSAVEFQQILRKDEAATAAPFITPLVRRVAREEGPGRGESLTWREAVDRQVQATAEESETVLAERQGRLWSDAEKEPQT